MSERLIVDVNAYFESEGDYFAGNLDEYGDFEIGRSGYIGVLGKDYNFKDRNGEVHDITNILVELGDFVKISSALAENGVEFPSADPKTPKPELPSVPDPKTELPFPERLVTSLS